MAKMGRPTKYKKIYCKQLVDFMAKGYSFEAFAGETGVALQTLYDWCDAQPDFLESKKEAFNKSRLFWEKVAIDHLVQKEGGLKLNNAAWIFNMKNRFGWRDQPKDQQRDSSIKIDSDDDDL